MQTEPTPQESPFKGKTGLRRLLNAFGYSVEGFKAAYKHEDAFRQEVFFAILLVPLALYLGENATEKTGPLCPLSLSSSRNWELSPR